MRKVFVSAKELLEADVTPAVVKRRAPAPVVDKPLPQATPLTHAPASEAPRTTGAPTAQPRVAQAPAFVPPPVPAGPTLQQQHRPDLAEFPQRHAEAHGAYHDQGNKFKSLRNLAGSANSTFHGETDSGHQFILKPHGGAEQGHEPERWASRNHAANMVLHHMGAGHMGAEAFHTQVPQADRLGPKVRTPAPDANDTPEKQRKMLHSHLGQDALAVKFNPDVARTSEMTPDQLAKVNGQHRAVGLVHHLLFGQGDGHHGNVLIDKKHNHPVMIDNDLALNSHHNAQLRTHPDNKEGKQALMSVFAPGEDLDYRNGTYKDPTTGQEMPIGEIGNDFSKISPELHNTIAWLAQNGHMAPPEQGGLGLAPDDAEALTQNARELMLHGLEGTLQNRWVKPTYKKKDEMQDAA